MIRRTAVLLLLLLPLAARAETLLGDRWTQADTLREGAFLALLWADWRQTREIVARPETYWEINPVLGRHPTAGRVDNYFAAAAFGHVLVALALPPPYRAAFQWVTVGWEADVVYRNYRIGLRFGF